LPLSTSRTSPKNFASTGVIIMASAVVLDPVVPQVPDETPPRVEMTPAERVHDAFEVYGNLLAQIKGWKASGLRLQDIADRLNTEEWRRVRYGSPWSARQVKWCLQRARTWKFTRPIPLCVAPPQQPSRRTRGPGCRMPAWAMKTLRRLEKRHGV
jgi:hypothetical protein